MSYEDRTEGSRRLYERAQKVLPGGVTYQLRDITPHPFYVKKAHVGKVPGLEEFIVEFTSDRASGEDGYLADKGLIPMPDEQRMAVREAGAKMTLLEM